MNTFIELKKINLDIPVYDARRSFRISTFQYLTGGQIMQNKTNNKLTSIRALDNISFRLEKGDRLGLIGHNGSGKTTLLRVLAGTYKPLAGTIQCKGKITPLFNIAVGMDLDDTGEENIATVGMYLGMTKKEIEDRKEEIIEFSELGDFINLPVRTYSAGMQVRLSFAIATALKPEILLLDEGIGAGDAQFAEKAKARLEEFYRGLDILVIATHSDALIRQLCNKALLLEHGKIKTYGAVDAVLEAYHAGIVQ